ncbi:Transcription factor TFIIIC [Melia azedarach]|uniref:Transcription factor TFIIIC n=2 Tax=Melia azedarach TaxID=155640 RepID=A0ACC1XVH3_MELAZ|nr:Transcription factor TFIIIC [Melia azedarach]KAJ4715138.1 Transcription factor TFIIIC [Melia azedarach]
MEANIVHHSHEEDDEEFVLLDLDVLSGRFEIPPNAPYVLSGLGTLNPVLIIDNKIRLIGEYEETIGTCFVFSEDEGAPVVHEETGSSELNLFSGKCIIDSNQAPKKQLNPVARLHKILKFRVLLDDDDVQDAATGPSN